MNNRNNRRFTRTALTLAILATFAQPAAAGDTTWISLVGNWNVGGNWNNGVPAAGDNAFLTVLGGGLTFFDGPSTPTLGRLEIDNGMTLVQFMETLTTTDTWVGTFSTGAYDQAGGTHQVLNDLSLAPGIGGSGDYQLNGGSLLVGRNEYVGAYGRSTFQQTSGTHGVAEQLWVAVAPDANGSSFNLSGGTLSVGQTAFVGFGGEGSFSQSGGSTTVGNDLILGAQASGDGAYNLSGTGQLEVMGNEWVGQAGSGTFNQFDTTIHIVRGNLYVDPIVLGKTGTFNLEGGDLQVDGMAFVGNTPAGSPPASWGTFNQTWGTASIGQGLILGVPQDSQGTYNLYNGTLNDNDNTIVGDAGVGIFNNFSSGTHNVAVDLILGNQATGNGTYNLHGTGEVWVSGNTLVGRAGAGVFSQIYGSASTSGLYLGGDPGGYEPGGNGTYNLFYGDLGSSFASVGQDGVGVFNQSSGQHRGDFLLLGNSGSSFANSSGTYNLMGNSELFMNNTTVGGFGYGEFNQSDGLHEISVDLVVGSGPAIGGTPTRQGVYTLSGDGEVWVGGDSIIGRGNDSFAGEPGGLGSFTQTGGLHEVAGNLILGQSGSEGNGNGSYTLAGTGQLNTNASIVGQGGVGTFNQHDGVHDTLALVLGADAGGMGTYNLHGGTLNDSAIIGDAGTGVFNNTGNNFGSTHNVTGDLVLGNQATGHGTYNLSGDTSGPNAAILDVSGNTVVGGAGTGVFNQSGGAHSTGEVQVGASGTYNLSAGNLVAGGMSVTAGGTLNYSGGSLDLGPGTLTNAGQVNLSGAGTRTIDGNVVNDGTFKITDTTANFTGTFTNNGAYISDPSDNHFVDLVIGASGYLVGGAGDNWHITGDFENHSEENLLWNTVDAYLGFTGTGPQEFLLAGMDFGLDAAGWNNNFAWGSLFLGSGSTLSLGDGNLGNASTALYVDALLLEGNNLSLLNNIFGNGFNIYYDVNDSRNAYLAGGDYSLGGGGRLIAYGGTTPPPPAVPEPATLALLALGLLGLGYSRRRR